MNIIKVSFALIFTLASFHLKAQSNTKMNNTHSTEIIRYEISQDRHQAFEEAYAAAGVHLQASPYCMGYNILKGDDEPDHYIITIYWTSREDHMSKFRNGKDFPPFLKLVRPYYNDIKEMKHYTQTAIDWKREN